MTDVEGREVVTFITHEYAENEWVEYKHNFHLDTIFTEFKNVTGGENAVSHRFRDALYMWNMQDLKQNKTPKGAL